MIWPILWTTPRWSCTRAMRGERSSCCVLRKHSGALTFPASDRQRPCGCVLVALAHPRPIHRVPPRLQVVRAAVLKDLGSRRAPTYASRLGVHGTDRLGGASESVGRLASF